LSNRKILKNWRDADGIGLRFFVAQAAWRDIGGKSYKVREETTGATKIAPFVWITKQNGCWFKAGGTTDAYIEDAAAASFSTASWGSRQLFRAFLALVI
jgi:hypothetical protein